MATAFSTQGATPAFGTPTALNNLNVSLGSTPQTRALTNMSAGGMQTSTPQVTMPQAPTQPVTSHSVTDAAGNTVTQKYATPEPGILSSQQGSGTPANTQSSPTTPTVGGSNSLGTANPNANFGGGVLAPNLSSNAPTAQPSGMLSNTTPQVSNLGVSTPNTSQSAIGSSPTASGLLSTVAGYGATDPGLTDLYNQQQALTTDFANREANIQSTPTTLNEQTGRLASIQNEYNTAEANLASTYQANLAQRAQGIGASESALGTATQLTPSPYGQPLVNPATGQDISGGQNINSGMLSPNSSSGGAIQPNDPAYSSLQQYANLVANGSMAASAVPTFGSNPVTLAQLQSMAQQINPNYNPLTTPLNTETQANTNASIGAGNQTQAAATTQAISRIGNITSNLNSFLTQWGLNATASPYYNSPMNTFLSSGSGAGAVASWKLITSDLQAATSQLMNTPGITPTGFTAELQSFDPTNLSPAELNTYLQALSSAGQYQLNSYQTTATGAYNSNTPSNANAPVQPYIGSKTSSTPAPLPLPANPAAAQAANAPTAGKVVGGAVLNALGGIEGLISGGLGYLASFL